MSIVGIGVYLDCQLCLAQVLSNFGRGMENYQWRRNYDDREGAMERVVRV